MPEEVKANVEAFLTEIRARRRWSFNLGVALAPDTNIGGGSDERTIIIHGLPFERDADEWTASGIGLSIWGGAEYQVPVSERLRVRAGTPDYRDLGARPARNKGRTDGLILRPRAAPIVRVRACNRARRTGYCMGMG